MRYVRVVPFTVIWGHIQSRSAVVAFEHGDKVRVYHPTERNYDRLMDVIQEHSIGSPILTFLDIDTEDKSYFTRYELPDRPLTSYVPEPRPEKQRYRTRDGNWHEVWTIARRVRMPMLPAGDP